MENTFLDRLKVEKDDLLDKVNKLANFLARDVMNDNPRLSEANHILLNEQLEAMNSYLNILIIRLELLEK